MVTHGSQHVQETAADKQGTGMLSVSEFSTVQVERSGFNRPPIAICAIHLQIKLLMQVVQTHLIWLSPHPLYAPFL